eukprot:4388775-Prymnesium_polylepis.1
MYLTTSTQEGTTAPSGQLAHIPLTSERKFCWSASGIEPRTLVCIPSRPPYPLGHARLAQNNQANLLHFLQLLLTPR